MYTEYSTDDKLVANDHASVIMQGTLPNIEKIIKTIPPEILIRNFVTCVKRLKTVGVSVNELADIFHVHRSTVNNWIRGKSIPHNSKWPDRSIYSYVNILLKNKEQLAKFMFGENIDQLKADDMPDSENCMANVNSLKLFDQIKQNSLVTNFVEVIKTIADEYAMKSTAYENLATIFDCHSTTIANWISGKTSPHSTLKPKQTIYHRIDLLRTEYGDKFDDMLKNGVQAPPVEQINTEVQVKSNTDDIEHKLAFVAFCKALKHIRDKTDYVGHKDLANILGCDTTVLYQYISLIKGDTNVEIPSVKELAKYLSRFRNRFGGKYDRILNNRKHPELIQLLDNQDTVIPAISDNSCTEQTQEQNTVVSKKPELRATIFERKQASGQLTVVEAIMYLKQRLTEINTEQEDILNQMATLENRSNILITEEKDVQSQLSVLNKILGISE